MKDIGVKLNWTGLLLMMALPLVGFSNMIVAGAVVMGLGTILMWMDK